MSMNLRHSTRLTLASHITFTHQVIQWKYGSRHRRAQSFRSYIRILHLSLKPSNPPSSMSFRLLWIRAPQAMAAVVSAGAAVVSTGAAAGSSAAGVSSAGGASAGGASAGASAAGASAAGVSAGGVSAGASAAGVSAGGASVAGGAAAGSSGGAGTKL